MESLPSTLKMIPFPSPTVSLPPPNTTAGDDQEITSWKNKGKISERLQPSPSPISLPVQNSSVAFSGPSIPAITRPEKKNKTGFERIEEGLAAARVAIHRAIRSQNSSSYEKGSYVPRGAMYRNQYAFHQLSSLI
ncbi:hypothetical protein OIU78_003440 [Salix suchowensis]|nr:hypothetical protein OIU78_003440 [Salix suchowensis]